ncbi:MAG: hypothetical protein AB7D57_11300 [Desulfovibrionaceae bacterium]
MQKMLLFVVLLLAAMLFANVGPDLADQAVRATPAAPAPMRPEASGPVASAPPPDADPAARPHNTEEDAVMLLLQLLAQPTP